MNGWILYDVLQYNKNKWFADQLLKESLKYADVKIVLVEQLQFGIKDGMHFFQIEGIETPCPDFVVCRTIFPILSFALEASGAKVFNNSETARICNDKRLTYSYVCSPLIPTVETFFHSKRFSNLSKESTISFPKIIKSSSGHGGNEVFLVNDTFEYQKGLSNMCPTGYVEQSICHPFGKDLRVYVLNDNIIASILRSSENYKSNYSIGGQASVYHLSTQEQMLVKRVIELIPAKMDFVGIDFLLSDDGLLFNEIEDVVGTRMLYDVMNIDVAEIFIEYVIRKAKEYVFNKE